eukprot:721646-Pyramimonas_sp.AAC.1
MEGRSCAAREPRVFDRQSESVRSAVAGMSVQRPRIHLQSGAPRSALVFRWRRPAFRLGVLVVWHWFPSG